VSTPADGSAGVTGATRPRLSIVTVTWNSAPGIGPWLEALRRELRDGDELIVVDNASSDGTAEAVTAADPAARVLRRPANEGFSAGCDAGAAVATGDLLVFLNPDAIVQPGFAEAITRPQDDGRGWGAWMGLVTAEDGRVVNTAGNVVHFSGLAWAGQSGVPVERADLRRAEVPYLSGACLAIPRATFERIGGFPAGFFLYHEDLDLSLRVRLDGAPVGIEPDARVDHDYEFDKGAQKWRGMERNRWAVLLRLFPGPVLVAAAPALVAAEVAVWLAALAGGWVGAKAAASADVVRDLPSLLRQRRELAPLRDRVSPATFASWLATDLDSPNLPGIVRTAPVRLMLRAYWSAAQRLLSTLPA
jgi:GT2 family glycosyltransferase